MKRNSIFFCLFFAIAANLFITAKAQVNTTDSLALVDLYNSTNGPDWDTHTNWLTTAPVSTWYGVTVTGTRVTTLYLFHNKLRGAIPATIGNLVSLVDLRLYKNKLSGNIPAALGNLINLKTLSLYDNKLSGAIPAMLGNLANISEIYLFDNQLTGVIPATFGNLVNLSTLELSSNQLTGIIPATLGSLTKLQSLILSSNQLTGNIPTTFRNLSLLNYIDVSFNQLSQDKNFSISIDSTSYANGYLIYNLFTFDGLEFIATKYPNFRYGVQNTILPIHQNSNVLSVYAGGTLKNNTYSWFKTGSAASITITGDSTFIPVQSGHYYVSVTNKVAKYLTLYSDTINFVMPLPQTQNSVANVAAVKEVNSHFSIYPNPAKDVIHVQVNGNAIVIVTNSNGKILLTKSINNSGEINVSAFANGIYYIQNKTTGETQKVIVLH